MEDQRTPTSLYLLPSLPFPITVQRIRAEAGREVRKTDALFSYSHLVKSAQDSSVDKRVDFWDSPVQGHIKQWHIKPGQVISDPTQPIVDILEPCTHDVQLHGLCALCGKDLTEVDYTGFSQTSRAAISMVHDEGGLTVSLNEASRIEEQTTKRLLESQKLSLIVDLDQTIIHATVDPTVGEWLADESNPNHKALRDVSKFKLEHEDDGCWYYVKPRPGLHDFLQTVKDLYEMHVYTMGTRAYASKVCNLIDPDGSLFGGRILSRDESGSLTRKSLQRLFPCDTSMVVIIDDRADVWDASPNLLKVIPYDFFVGIGDINAAFLPKKQELPAHPALDPTTTSTTSTPPTTSSANDADLLVTPSDEKETADDVVVPAMSEAEASQAKSIASQIEDRPLSKAATTEKNKLDTKGVDLDAIDGEDTDAHANVPILRDDDKELSRILNLLQTVHRTFFEETKNRKQADVKIIVPAIKREVFKGVKMSFSGLIPLGTRPEDSEYWRIAVTFGAQCFAELQPAVTHLVAAQSSTEKVYRALRRREGPAVKVVWTQWLLDCVAHWTKLDEKPYLIDGRQHSDGPPVTPVPNSPTTSAALLMEEGGLGSVDDQDGLDRFDDIRVDSIDWGDASKEIEDALNETDDSETDTDVETAGPSSSRKRVRISTGGSGTDTDEDEQNGSTTQTDSPLQKRVKTSRSRQSGLKHSYRPESSEADDPATSRSLGSRPEGIETPQKGKAAVVDPPSSQPGSQRSSEVDSDDEAFFASMAAEVEKGFA